eukprot:scaffold40435_cov45-Phaeocystis_antarctica.AAC.1
MRRIARLNGSRRSALDLTCVLGLLLRGHRRLPCGLGLLATRVGWDVIAVLLLLARYAHSGRSTSAGKTRRSNHGRDHRSEHSNSC